MKLKSSSVRTLTGSTERELISVSKHCQGLKASYFLLLSSTHSQYEATVFVPTKHLSVFISGRFNGQPYPSKLTSSHARRLHLSFVSGIIVTACSTPSAPIVMVVEIFFYVWLRQFRVIKTTSLYTYRVRKYTKF